MKKKMMTGILMCLLVAVTACGKKAEETVAPEEPAVEAEAEAPEANGAVSDETFAALQENYDAMVEAYNAVKELYESDEIVADTEVEALINEAADIINEMGEITQDSITETDANTLNQAILDIVDGLSATVDAMQTTDGSSGEVLSVPANITNNTGVEIHQMFLSASTLEEWGDDVLGNETFSDGSTVECTLNIDADTLVWDVLIADAEGNEIVFSGLDFSESSTEGVTIVLEYDEESGEAIAYFE